MSTLCNTGDRIRLLHMGNDPCPIETGAEGTVTHVQDCAFDRTTQIGVNWDNGRTLSLIYPEDRFEVIERASG